MTDAATKFALSRYVVLPALLEEPRLSQFYRYACKLSAIQESDDEQVPGSPSCYRDFMMGELLTSLQPQIEKSCGLELFPTYSYFRMYQPQAVLAKHTDRPSCEISVTLCLGYEAEKSWPLNIEGPLGISTVSLLPGDALLYRGRECPHWRDAFDGQQHAQVFLHYVDKNGPYAEWKFDKRPGSDELDRVELVLDLQLDSSN